ncbi:MAG: DUF6786 family protein, partial [Sphingobacterium sp.]
MNKRFTPALLGIAMIVVTAACQQNKKSGISKQDTVKNTYKEGQFGYDLQFLQKFDSVLLLSNESGLGQIVVSPKYQGKVFTSSADGFEGKSFGWVNYKAFNALVNQHM